MCGGRAPYEETIATRRFRPIAMSVLASGALAPRDAIDYVCRQKNIRSIVFGASTRAHIEETKRLIDELSSAPSQCVAREGAADPYAGTAGFVP